MTNVLEYLEHSEAKLPEKLAFTDNQRSVTYKEVVAASRRIGTALTRLAAPRRPVAVMMEKGVRTIEVFFGIVYAGCPYSLLDPRHPASRLEQILSILDAQVLVTDKEHEEYARSLSYNGLVICVDRLMRGIADDDALRDIRLQSSSTDPLYINFTSGSTGVPKGVVVGHASVIEFIDSFTEICSITRADVIGNQAPFDFDVSVKDIYSTVSKGATMVIIPRKLFSFPKDLIDFICDREITTLIWAVSALCIISALKGLEYRVPERIRKVIFSGEVMPVKHLNIWRSALPGADFFNVYGPTEITCNCTYYKIKRDFLPGEVLPIGQPFPGERVFLLDEENHLITSKMPGVHGEICVGGTCLALGYYNNPEQTSLSFVQDPLDSRFRDIVYKTGDLACYLEDGNLCFLSRKDFQIKHMGHRIELGEIEAAMERVEGLERSCVLYWKEKERICAFYEGNAERKQIVAVISEILPSFMIPNVFHKVESFPVTANGKIDRKTLQNTYLTENSGKQGR